MGIPKISHSYIEISNMDKETCWECTYRDGKCVFCDKPEPKTTNLSNSDAAAGYKPMWIPVDKRLPEKDQLVLMFHNFGDSVDTSVGVHDRFWAMNSVTHWMPIPEPPTD